MRLYLLRHGKADKESPTGRDEDRPLVDEGLAQADFIASAFRAALPPVEERPQNVISSSASRARDTAEHVARALGTSLMFDGALFPDQHVRRALRVVADLVRRPDAEPALLVGHNPQLEDLISVLSGRVPERLRTGELAALDVEFRDGHPVGRLIGTVRVEDER